MLFKKSLLFENNKYLSLLIEKKSDSPSVMSGSLRPHGLYSPWNSPGHNTGVGSLSLFQGICPTQESSWGLLHCRQILYQLGYQGSPSRPSELTPKRGVLFTTGDRDAKVGSGESPGVAGKLGLATRGEAGQRLTAFFQENTLGIANTLFQ